jgi:hypothetical protein
VFLDPEGVGQLSTLAHADRLREGLARDVFPRRGGGPPGVPGPMQLGPGDVPVRDVVVTLR